MLAMRTATVALQPTRCRAAANAIIMNQCMNQIQIRMKHPALRKKIRKKREKKLEKRRLKAAGEWETPDYIPQSVALTISKEDTQSILRAHCSRRDIKLNKRQTQKAWIMGLLVHRYDKGVRDLDKLNEGGLRHPLTPPQHSCHDYIHANVSPDVQHRFSKKNLTAARETIRRKTMGGFAEEAWRIMKERKIPPPLPAERMEGLIHKEPYIFLSLFSRAMAQANSPAAAGRMGEKDESDAPSEKINPNGK